MQLRVVWWVMVCSCMWVSFDYCRFIELDYIPMEAGIMVSMRQSRGFLTPKSPERQSRSEHQPSIAHSFCLNLLSLCFFLCSFTLSGIPPARINAPHFNFLICLDCIPRHLVILLHIILTGLLAQSLPSSLRLLSVCKHDLHLHSERFFSFLVFFFPNKS